MEKAKSQLTTEQQSRDAAADAASRSDERLKNVQHQIKQAKAEIGDYTIPPEQLEELQSRVELLVRRVTAGRVNLVTEKLRKSLGRDQEQAQQRIRSSENKLWQAIKSYRNGWATQAASLTDDLAATPDYLALLDKLQAEGLPRYEKRFRQLLVTQAQNTAGQLRSQIRGATQDIRNGLRSVNESLKAVFFDPERQHTLEIRVAGRQDGEVKDFLDDLTAVSTGALSAEFETAAEAEVRFLAMQKVMHRLGSGEPVDLRWRQRVLDTRKHVNFTAIERDQAGRQHDIYESSGGRSGGQRQRLVTFCLAAALRYQLVSGREQFPGYGLVILDEAFSNSDQKLTRTGLQVFHQFGFQLLLATPLTMPRAMEDYIGGVCLVSSPQKREANFLPVLFEDAAESTDAAAKGDKNQ